MIPFTIDEVIAAYRHFQGKYVPATGGFAFFEDDAICVCPITILLISKLGEKIVGEDEILIDSTYEQAVRDAYEIESNEFNYNDFWGFVNGYDNLNINIENEGGGYVEAYEFGKRCRVRLQAEGLLTN